MNRELLDKDQPSDLSDISRPEVLTLGIQEPSFLAGILHIVGVGAKKEMRGLNAIWPITRMKTQETLWNLPLERLEAVTVEQHLVSIALLATANLDPDIAIRALGQR